MKPSGTIKWILTGGDALETPSYEVLNVLAHADTFEIDIPQACGGQAECGTCRVAVISGEVTPALADEQDLMEQHRKRFEPNERLGCRARPIGDLTIAVGRRALEDLREVSAAD
mgnify:CR=1 FL=1